MKKPAASLFTIIPIVLMLLVSCGIKNGSVTVTTGNDDKVLASLASVDGTYQGLIVFITGEVLLNRQGVESLVSIGDSILSGDTIETAADSYCEIQFGETAVIRLDENTLYKVEALNRSESETTTRTRLVQGTILCKVNKLTDKSRFHIRTNDTICGVRGTQFLVSMEGPATRIAVNEGSVFVLPVQFDLTDDTRPEARAAEVLVFEEAPLVGAGQQILIDGDKFKDKAETLDLILTSFTITSTTEDSPESTRLREFTREQAAEVLTGRETIQPVETEIEQKMKVLDEMETRPLPSESDKEPLILIRIQADPSDAVISINGIDSGSGSLSGFWKKDTKVTISVRKEGFTEKTVDYQATEQAEQSLRISLGREPAKQIQEPVKKPAVPPAKKEKTVKVQIQTDPSDAVLSVNGKTFTGSYSEEVRAEERLSITADRIGYTSEKMSIKAAQAGSLTIKLKPEPLYISLTLSEGAINGAVLSSSGRIFFNDQSGKLFAVSKEGKLLWSKQTENTVTENSVPVLFGDQVYLSGDREVISFNQGSGTVTGSFALSSEDNHLFGKRVTGSAEGIWLPLKQKVVLLNPASLAVIRETPLSAETRMTPLYWKNNLYLLDISGNWLTIDSTTGKVLATLPTGAKDSVAMAPFIQDGKAFFSGRKGSLICMDLEKNSILWEITLPENTQVFTDITGDGKVIALFTGKAILVFSKDNGSLLYAINDASCPPLTKGGKLYFGTNDGKLIISDLVTGKEEKQLEVGDIITTKPLFDFGILFAGTESGKILLIIPEAIK